MLRIGLSLEESRNKVITYCKYLVYEIEFGGISQDCSPKLKGWLYTVNKLSTSNLFSFNGNADVFSYNSVLKSQNRLNRDLRVENYILFMSVYNKHNEILEEIIQKYQEIDKCQHKETIKQESIYRKSFRIDKLHCIYFFLCYLFYCF